MISFGEQNVEKVCGFVEGLDEKIRQNAEQYTKFFEEKWNNNLGSWSDSSKGKVGFRTVCNSSGLIMPGSEEGKETLAVCYDRDSAPNVFIEKMKQEQKISLGACIGDCLEAKETGVQSIKQLENTKGEGKEVKFFTEKN